MNNSRTIPSSSLSQDLPDLGVVPPLEFQFDQLGTDVANDTIYPASGTANASAKLRRRNTAKNITPAETVPSGHVPQKRRKKTPIAVAAADVVSAACTAGDKALAPPPVPLQAFTGFVVQISTDLVEVWERSIDRTESLDADLYGQVLESIRRAGINTVPVLVRRIEAALPGAAQYTLIAGQLRLRACQELGFDVQAQVEEPEGLDDTAALRHMLTTNHGRQAYAPLAIGRWVNRMLEEGVFATAKALCEFCEWDEGDVSKARALASLPHQVIDAFTGTSGPQYRHSAPLSKMVEIDREGLLHRAAAVLEQNRDAGFTMKPRDIMAALLQPKPEPAKAPSPPKSKCDDCKEGPQALMMAEPFSNSIFITPVAQGASAEDSSAAATREHSQPLQLAKLQVHHDHWSGQDADAEEGAGAGLDTVEVLPSSNSHAASPASDFVLPKEMPSNAIPIVTLDGTDLGYVFRDARGFTFILLTAKNLGERDREWLAENAEELLCRAPYLGRTDTAIGGGKTA